jgi:FkbM family methyltransferase
MIESNLAGAEVSAVKRIASALQVNRERWLGRLGRLVRATEAAGNLGVPLSRAFDRNWAAAVSMVSFPLLPRAVREHLDVVVDVGANRGDWSAAVLSLSRPREIFAFEPNPEVFAQMRARLEHRGVHCRQAAVGARAGLVALNVEAQPELSSIRMLSAHGRQIHGIDQAPRTIEVPMVTLDDELAGQREISLLKLDVQGYESAVVEGARNVLARTRCLVTEVLYDRDYYDGASSCLDLARLIEGTSPLRLSCMSAPALAPDGCGAWADAIFLNPDLIGQQS